MVITKDMVSKQSRKTPNWKSPGRYGFQEFWTEKLTNLDKRTAFQLNKILNGNEQLSDWLTYELKVELKVTQWTIIYPSLVYHHCGSF